jgi:Kef-type K+ transport system membrane component KefB
MLDHCAFVLVSDARMPLALLVVFAAAKLLAELCERIKIPGIVGEIAAGVVLGPSVLGWIAPSDMLSLLSDLGVMFLLFRVGLEVKASDLLRVGGTATAVATAGVIAPMALGWGLMTWWGSTTTEALFVGAAMVATSVGITAQVLASKGYLHLLSSRLILAAAVIDDVLGLLVLAVVSSAAKGRVNLLDVGLTTLFAAGFVIVAAKWGTPAMSRVLPQVHERLRVAEGEYALAIVFLFALSLLAVKAGVAAIVGAFLAGMALSESAGRRVKDFAHGTAEFLIPFFLAGIGLKVDLKALATRDGALLAAALLVLAVISKLIGCGLGAIRLGRAEMLRIGIGMVPRGEVGMVVAQLGLGIGALSSHVYAVVVVMAVATTIVCPPLLSLAYRGAESVREQAEEVLHI